jgi:xylulokinase
MPTALGIDLGTSSLKVVLIDEGGAILASVSRPLAVNSPFPGASEQNPKDWWVALESAIGEIRSAEPGAFADVGGIGLSGQMHGLVCLGKDDSVLRPAILWNDNRARAQAERFRTDLELEARAGLKAAPGLTACKIAWVQSNEQETWHLTARITLCKDYLRLRMTGIHATDPCDAAGTLLFDEIARDWCDRSLALFGLSRAMLPVVFEGPMSTGGLISSVAARWGLRPGTPVVAGAGDGAAGAIGIGATRSGSGFISLGTSAQMSVAQDRYVAAPGSTIQTLAHGLPNLWYSAAALQSGAGAISWAARLGGMSVKELLINVADLDPTEKAPVFLPYLAGERTPHDNPDARGVVFGLLSEHGAAHVGRAVLRGLSFAMADAHDALARLGPMPSQLYIIGGGARSSLLCRMVASILDTELVLLAASDASAALGAARMALATLSGAGPEAFLVEPDCQAVIAPEPELRNSLQSDLPLYRDLYQALVPGFAALPEGSNPQTRRSCIQDIPESGDSISMEPAWHSSCYN